MKSIFVLCFLLGLSLAADTDNLTTKRTTGDIFRFLETDNDWTNVLYICDFLKTSFYSCNVTLQGAEYLKNSSVKSPEKVTGQKLPKFVIQNVTGTWTKDDGILKSHLFTLNDTDIAGKCLFRTTYYECYGIPRCDHTGGMSPCRGGEPWRGQYTGAPNTGFTGTITNIAMESAAIQPQDQQPFEKAGNLVQPAQTTDGLAPQTEVFASGNASTNGQTLVTITNSSGTFTSSGPEALGAAIEVPANGSISVVQVSPITDQDGTRRGGVQVSSFASFGSGPNGAGNVMIGPMFGPGGKFGGIDFSGGQPLSPDTNQSTPDSPDPHNCTDQSGQGDFSRNLRCLIQNFQKSVFQSVGSSFRFPGFRPFQFNFNNDRSPFMPFGRMGGPIADSNSMFQSQSQSMGPMYQSQGPAYQSQSRSFNPRFGGFKIMIVPDNTPQQRDDDDMNGFLNFRK